MYPSQRVSIIELVTCLSKASDLISPQVVNHQIRVAYLANSLAENLGYSQHDQMTLLIAGSLHDVGAFSLTEKLDLLQFDSVEGIVPHAITGHLLLKDFPGFESVADLILFHHLPWRNTDSANHFPEKILQLANLIYLADRIDVLLNYNRDVLTQIPEVKKTIFKLRGELFSPELVDAFLELADDEQIWFNLEAPKPDLLLFKNFPFATFQLSSLTLEKLAVLFSRVIDFRSHYTALHSSSVAGGCLQLAKIMSLPEEICQLLKFAGHLHDFGKIALPKELIEKTEPLTEKEFSQIKRHTYHSYHLFKEIPAFSTINEWMSYHHEQPTGEGYPFGIKGKDLSLEARIVAVADVFSAVTEQRPYRQNLVSLDVSEVLREKKDKGQLDADVVTAALDCLDRLKKSSDLAKKDAQDRYYFFEKEKLRISQFFFR